jgi:Bacterial PH domain
VFIASVAAFGWCAFTLTSPRGGLGGWLGAWFVVGVATCSVVLKVLFLITDRSRLQINGEGLRLRRGHRDVFLPWADVGGFRVGKCGSRRVVCFDYSAEARHKYPARSLPEGYAEGDDRIVDDYPLKPEALAELLNRSRGEGLESARVAAAQPLPTHGLGLAP